MRNYTFSMRKRLLSVKLAIKKPEKIIIGLIIGSFCFFGLSVSVFASQEFFDNFDSYVLDSVLDGQNSWVSNSNTTISNDYYVSSPYNVECYYGGYARRAVPDLATGIFSGDMLVETPYYQQHGLCFSGGAMLELWHNDFSEVACRIGIAEADAPDNRFTNGGISGDVLLDYLDICGTGAEKYRHFEFYFDADIDKIKICFDDAISQRCSDWADCKVGAETRTFDTIDGIGFRQSAHSMIIPVYYDNIDFSGLPCSQENCGACADWFDCQVAGCCWYYNPYFMPTNYCGDCYLECGIENCGSCYTQADCETAGCYWTGDYCAGIFQECGDGLACQFCGSQADCETAGCYWSSANQSCWYQVSESPIVSWTDYYADNGGYENPLPFVNNLASASAGIFASVSEMLNAFETSFDTGQALANGNTFGNAVPKARGYLTIIDNFFGMPVAEIFLIVIIFILAVGLFRIIRGLIGLVKI